MSEATVPAPAGPVPACLEVPQGQGPFPGVVIVHDAVGMSADLRRQARWLAEQGFVAIGPDLYHWGGTARCVVSTIRDAVRRSGRAFDDLEACRRYLVEHPACTGKVGVIGFCMGGGFAVLLAPREGWGAASVNYGAVPKDAEELLRTACPIVGSYGGLDKTLRGDPDRLRQALAANGIEHDIEVYPEADHSFLNDHEESEVPIVFRWLGALFGGGEPHQPSAAHARERIAAFLHRQLDP